MNKTHRYVEVFWLVGFGCFVCVSFGFFFWLGVFFHNCDPSDNF